MSASYYDLTQRYGEVHALHAHNVCSYLRGRLNARVVERLAPDTSNGGLGLARYRIIRRGHWEPGTGEGDQATAREWVGTLPEICREFGLDIGRVVEQCR